MFPHSSPVSGFSYCYKKITAPLKYDYQSYQKRLILVISSVNTFIAGSGLIHNNINISRMPFPVTWNFRCRHRIPCSLRCYHRRTTEVAHICTTYYGTKCDASVTGCEHIYHSIFKNWYLRTETSQGHEIWHVYSHMSLLNRQKKKKVGR